MISMLTGDKNRVGSRSDTNSHWEHVPSHQCQPQSSEAGAHLGFLHTSLALGCLLQHLHNRNAALDTDWSHFIQDL